MDYNRAGSGDLDALKASDGSLAPSAPGVGCTLTATTYYMPFGSGEAPAPGQTSLLSAHLKWNAAFAGTITVESCNFPATSSSTSTRPDVSDIDTTAGNWCQENASGDYVSEVAGSGNSITALTVTAGGTNAGGVLLHLKDRGAQRYRLKVVCTTGGILRVNTHCKNGS